MSWEDAGPLIPWLWQASVAARLKRLEEGKGKAKANGAALRAVAAEKIAQGVPVTREEAAAFRGVSKRHLQRLEDRGQLRRCPGCDHPVSYAARDIRRLASANGRED